MRRIKQIFWNEDERRSRAFWRLLLQILVLLLFSIILGLTAFVVVSLVVGENFIVPVLTQSLEPPDEPFVNTIFTIASLMAFVFSIWFSGRFFDQRRFADFGLHFSREWWLDLGFGLFLGAFLMAVIFVIEWGVGWVTIQGVWQSGVDELPFVVAILDPLIVFLCVGIYEELWSRGYQLKNMAEGLSFLNGRTATLLALVISSIIFGLLHAANPNATVISTFNIILAGLMIGLGYVLTGELAISIGLHITWNFFQGTVFGFPVSGGTFSKTTVIAIEQGGEPLITGGAFGPEAGLIGIAAMILGAILTLLWVWRRQGHVQLSIWLTTHEPRRMTEVIDSYQDPP
ncbi:CPBP family intramembrane metalloprotease [Chloroflexi bacterium TSY]|nr:CPBP family intramembrane metalloprotease [Chloroflexi bacterium TSY]